jgi:transposase
VSAPHLARVRISRDIGGHPLISGDDFMVTSMLDARNEGGAYQRVEVITGRQRRRRWTAEEKARIVAESFEADANISDVARRHGLARGLLTIWRRQLSGGGQEPGQSFAAVRIDTVAPVSNDAPRHSAESEAVALPVVRSRARIEIDVAGARIRIESGVDHATLAMVLAAVRGDR